MAFVEATTVSGTAKAVLEFAREASRPHDDLPPIEFSILTFARTQAESPFIRRVRQEGYSIDIVPEAGRFDFAVLPRIRRAVECRRPDILWTNAVKSHFLVRLAGLHRRAVWVAFHHGYTATDWRDRLYSQCDRWSPRAARRVVTVCQAFADALETRRILAGRIRIQPIPVRLSNPPSRETVEALRRELQIAPGERVLLHVGRLSAEKGQAELIHAVAEIRRLEPGLPLKLLIAGAGPELHRLQALSCRLEIQDAVRFLGHQDQVRPLYSLADVFVLPSHTEGSPNVILEALEAGVAVVATAVGGVPEMVADEENALLVEPRNVNALAKALLRAIYDEALRDRLVRAAAPVLERHSTGEYFRNMVSIFREAMST
jgi:glycosyltransferase involved in cell wall biosynthesis